MYFADVTFDLLAMLTAVNNKMLSYRRETALQGAL